MFWMKPGFTLFSYENFFTSARLWNFLASMYPLIHRGSDLPGSWISAIAVFVRRRIPQVAQHRVVLLFILPFMVSEIIRVFALRPVLQRNGLVNYVLMELGITSEPVTAILFTPLGVIIGEVMSFLPFIVVLRISRHGGRSEVHIRDLRRSRRQRVADVQGHHRAAGGTGEFLPAASSYSSMALVLRFCRTYLAVRVR